MGIFHLFILTDPFVLEVVKWANIGGLRRYLLVLIVHVTLLHALVNFIVFVVHTLRHRWRHFELTRRWRYNCWCHVFVSLYGQIAKHNNMIETLLLSDLFRLFIDPRFQVPAIVFIQRYILPLNDLIVLSILCSHFGPMTDVTHITFRFLSCDNILRSCILRNWLSVHFVGLAILRLDTSGSWFHNRFWLYVLSRYLLWLLGNNLLISILRVKAMRSRLVHDAFKIKLHILLDSFWRSQ